MRAKIRKHPPHNAVCLSQGDLDIYNEGRKMIRTQAKQKGISYSQAVREINESIASGMSSTKPAAREFWQAMKSISKHETPTAEEFVFYFSIKATATILYGYRNDRPL